MTHIDDERLLEAHMEYAGQESIPPYMRTAHIPQEAIVYPQDLAPARREEEKIVADVPAEL